MTAFLKMHGLGNDFAVFDARKQALALDAAAARAIADRRLGVGCDQVIVIAPAANARVNITARHSRTSPRKDAPAYPDSPYGRLAP